MNIASCILQSNRLRSLPARPLSLSHQVHGWLSQIQTPQQPHHNHHLLLCLKIARLYQQTHLPALAAVEAFKQHQCSGESLVTASTPSVTSSDATPKHTAHNFSATLQAVDVASQSAEISTDTVMQFMHNLSDSNSPAQCKGVTSATRANMAASNDWTMLRDIFGESMQLPAQRYFELTDNDFVKGNRRRCGSPLFSSTMYSLLKQRHPAPSNTI